ncbi:MAG: cation transporter [Planctomycetes bacterium]|nr:cation transporter [Planctomycetota bacterium]
MSNSRSQQVVTLVTLAGSGALVAGLFGAYIVFGSQLALAQAADSFMDVFTAGVLTWTVIVAAKPQDENHPFGHSRAEPIGGLVVAVVAGVLAIEVARSAGTALLSHGEVKLDYTLVGVFGAKTLFKTAIFFVATAARKRTKSPAMKALAVDARNDVLVSLLAIGGFFAARNGLPTLDSWLALPIAAWIAWSGIELARENVRYLMGEAPPAERQEQLRQLAADIKGVKSAHDLRAHYLGTEIQVHVHIVVDSGLTVLQAHDIGEAVRTTLENEDDVGHCSVHIDIKEDPGAE